MADGRRAASGPSSRKPRKPAGATRVRKSDLRPTRLAFLTLTIASVTRTLAAASPDGPVVIFLVDTLRPDRMSVYGAPHATTPAAERLAADGVVFEGAHSLSSWTRASVGTLFTSLLPAQAGTLDRDGRMNPAVTSLPELFHGRGWKTAAFVGNANVTPGSGFGRGFDVFENVYGPEPGLEALPHARLVVDPAVRFIERQESPRFFLYVHVLDPHLPFNLEPASRSLFFARPGGPRASERENGFLDYDRAIRQADDQFARIAAALGKKGFWERATIVYTSDHGEEFYEHGGRGHGTTLYEEQIRVPLIVKLPGGSGKSTRRDDLVSLADLVPTLAELHALPRDPAWIGANLFAPSARRPLYFTEDLDVQRLYATRSGARKLVVQLYPTFRRILFDLAADPGEQRGRELDCGEPASPDAQALLRLARTWREKELPFFPGVRFEKAAEAPLRVTLLANLGADARPFLTAEDACACAESLSGFMLRIDKTLAPGEPFHLALSADDRGKLPPYRLFVAGPDGRRVDTSPPTAAFRAIRTEKPKTEEPSSAEVEKLRNLGYLGGASRGASQGAQEH